jgi:PPOX class F420-dependent enzyme/OxyR family protein
VGRDGMPNVTPLGWSLGPTEDTIELSGRNFGASKKFRDVARTHQAAIVIDEVLPPWQPRGIEIRGNAEALNDPDPPHRDSPHARHLLGTRRRRARLNSFVTPVTNRQPEIEQAATRQDTM